MLITDVFQHQGRPRTICALALATTGIHSSDQLIGITTRTLTLEDRGDTWTTDGTEGRVILNRDIPADKLAASAQYHGITQADLEDRGLAEEQFKRAVNSVMVDVHNSDMVLIYNLDFLRRFLLKADAFIQVQEHIIDITALDRLIRSGTAVRHVGDSLAPTMRDLAYSCQSIGPGTLAGMRRAHKIPEPNWSFEMVPAANCSKMIDLFQSWMYLEIPVITTSV